VSLDKPTVRQARKKAKKTQADVVKYLGISPSTYIHYEADPSIIPVKRAYMLAEFFGMGLQDIKFF
jgi:transcriptional regulator with XRE-family HTH domain